MMRGLFTLAKLDLTLWRRSRWALVSALIPPLGMAVLLAVLTLSVGRQPVALVIEGHGASADIMAQIIENDTEAYALTVTDAAGATRMLRDQEVAAAIVIPPGFDQAVAAQRASLDLTLNNVDVDFADDIRRTAARSVAEFDAPQLGYQGELGGPSKGVLIPNPYRIAVAEHDLRATNVDFLRYQVLPAFVLLVLSVGVMGTALLGARDRERRTARHLVLAPVSSWSLVAGRLVGGLGASLAVLTPIVALSVAIGVIAPPRDHWPALIALFVCTALCASGIGATLGAWVGGTRSIAMTASILATYLFFLGGGFTTIAFLPDWLRTLSSLVPIRYAIDGLRQCLFYPDLHGLATDLIVLSATAGVVVLIGAVTVRRSWSA